MINKMQKGGLEKGIRMDLFPLSIALSREQKVCAHPLTQRSHIGHQGIYMFLTSRGPVMAPISLQLKKKTLIAVGQV